MCGRFTYLSYDEVREVIEDIEMSAPLNVDPDWPAVHPNAYPKSRVPIIKIDEQRRLLPAEMNWGFPAEWKKDVIFNTRIESAGKPFWSDSLSQRRCIVPAFSFFEPHRNETLMSPTTHRPIKQTYEFFMDGNFILLMAAIWKNDSFSILTTEPNESVSPIHPRMPLVLLPSEIHDWMEGDYEKLMDRSGVHLESKAEQARVKRAKAEQARVKRAKVERTKTEQTKVERTKVERKAEPLPLNLD